MKRKQQKNQMITSKRKSKGAKIVKNKDGQEALKIDNEIDLKEIVKSLELVKFKSDVLTCKYLSMKEEDMISAVIELAKKLQYTESKEIKFDNINESLESLVRYHIKDNFYSGEILESIMFIFESCVCLAIVDSFMNNSLKLVFDDEQPYVIAMGIGVLADGIYNGARRALTGEEPEEEECDCELCNKKRNKTTKVEIPKSLEEKRLETYKIWEDMLAKCYDPEHPEYKNEGAKGITVCDRWNPKAGGSFENFVEDMGLCSD